MKRLSLIALFLIFGLAASAQEFTLYGEGIMPTGRYSQGILLRQGGTYHPICAITDSTSNIGAATYGWGAGFQFAFPLTQEGFDLVLDAGFRMNWLNGKVQDYFDYYAANHNTEGITNAPHYYNIPLMAGPRFTIEPFDNFKFYLNFLLGIDLRIISDAIYAPDYHVDYYSTGALALRGAAGFLLFDHLRLEANWSWMGDNMVKACTYDGRFYNKVNFGHLETMQLGVRLGYTF